MLYTKTPLFFRSYNLGGGAFELSEDLTGSVFSLVGDVQPTCLSINYQPLDK